MQRPKPAPRDAREFPLAATTARRVFHSVLIVVALALVAASVPAVCAQEMAVDLELVLAVDVSGSMDADERLLQRSGYVAALSHPEVVAAIASGFHGRIAVTYVEWAGPSSQIVAVPWRLVDGPQAAEAFSRELAAAPSARIRGTSISGALVFAASQFGGSGYRADRQVIDVSGDGPNNMGPPVVPVRDAVVARDIAINGLPLLLKTGGPFGSVVPLDLYYRDCVIGGPGSFLIAVQDPAQFAEAIRRKLVLEIAANAPALIPASTRVQADGIDCLIGEKTRPQWLNEGER